MSANNDAAALRVFLLILGALTGFTLLIMFIASTVSAEVREKRMQDPAVQAAIAERIKPVGQVTLPGELAAAQAETNAMQADAIVVVSAPVSTPAAGAADNSEGKQIYDSACMVCHASGIAGSPKLTDTAAWQERLAKGIDTLYANAINGIGGMPPRGGRMDLTDEQIKVAVDYMVAGAK